MEPMSDAEYVDGDGEICPVCRAAVRPDQKELAEDPEEGRAEFRVECKECEERWIEVYVLDSYV